MLHCGFSGPSNHLVFCRVTVLPRRSAYCVC